MILKIEQYYGAPKTYILELVLKVIVEIKKDQHIMICYMRKGGKIFYHSCSQDNDYDGHAKLIITPNEKDFPMPKIGDKIKVYLNDTHNDTTKN